MEIAELVREAAALEFYGAARLIRHIDPLWQTEIGIERAWQARFVETDYAKCDCPNCDGCQEVRGSLRYVTVEALCAADAASVALLEKQPFEVFEGVRLMGSDTGFFEPA